MYAADDKSSSAREISRSVKTSTWFRMAADGNWPERNRKYWPQREFTPTAVSSSTFVRSCLTDATRLTFSDAQFKSSVPVHLGVDFRKGTGTLTVPLGCSAEIETLNLGVNGNFRSGQAVEPGIYPVTFKPFFGKGNDPIWGVLTDEETVMPEHRAGPLKRVGVAVVKKFDCPDALSGFCPASGGVLAGDVKGQIREFRGGDTRILFRIASSRPYQPCNRLTSTATDRTKSSSATTATCFFATNPRGSCSGVTR